MLLRAASPKIHVHTPLSQPQNPPELELDVEGLGLGDADVPVVVVPLVLLAEAEGDEAADVDEVDDVLPADFWTLFAFALVVPVAEADGLAVALGVLLAEAL